MTRMFALLASLSLAIASVNANGQDYYQHSQHDHGHRPIIDHDYWHHQVHAPNVAQLDAFSDQLAQVARHLHEDAHKLSQDYEHSETIEHFVDDVDRLQQHMHQILHEAVESGRQSSALTEHVKNDVRQVKSLFLKLDGELSHQGFDGARTGDFHAMTHMRQVIAQEAFPLIRKLEIELYGYALGGHRVFSDHDVHRSYYGSGSTWISSHR